jgi:hypothetical protein
VCEWRAHRSTRDGVVTSDVFGVVTRIRLFFFYIGADRDPLVTRVCEPLPQDVESAGAHTLNPRGSTSQILLAYPRGLLA